MADIFEQPSIYRDFRKFCGQVSGDLEDRFQRSMDEWDPHVLLLLNGLLFVNSQLKGHTDQRYDEFVQQLAFHFAPGETMARPGVEMLHFQTDVTRFHPGKYPHLEPFSLLQNDDAKGIGYLGGEPFSLIPGLSFESLKAERHEGQWQLRFRLKGLLPPTDQMPPVRCFLLDGASDLNYAFLDLLDFPGATCLTPGVTLRSAPQFFEYIWKGTPWYQEHLRHLQPYPGELDLFFDIDGLKREHWVSKGGDWEAEVVFALPRGCELLDSDFLREIKVKANTVPFFSYAQLPQVMLQGHAQELVAPRSEDVLWIRAWEGNVPLFQPGLLYLGRLLEQSEPHMWFWASAEKSPLIAELRSEHREVRVEALLALRNARMWRVKKVENLIFAWDTTAKERKQYNAGCSVFPLGRVARVERTTPKEIREDIWGWMAQNFMLTENSQHLHSLLKQSLKAAGIALDLKVEHPDPLRSDIRFTHVPGRGLVPSFEIQIQMPTSEDPSRAGSPLRGRLTSLARRLGPFLDERLPPHLQLVMSLEYPGHPPWCLSHVRKASS